MGKERGIRQALTELTSAFWGDVQEEVKEGIRHLAVEDIPEPLMERLAGTIADRVLSRLGSRIHPDSPEGLSETLLDAITERIRELLEVRFDPDEDLTQAARVQLCHFADRLEGGLPGDTDRILFEMGELRNALRPACFDLMHDGLTPWTPAGFACRAMDGFLEQQGPTPTPSSLRTAACVSAQVLRERWEESCLIADRSLMEKNEGPLGVSRQPG